MFAVVRTGGKQYRVTAGDKIVVEKLAGETGDRIDITDILLAGAASALGFAAFAFSPPIDTIFRIVCCWRWPFLRR